MRQFPLFRRVAQLLVAALMLGLFAGCEEDLSWDPKTSLNVMQPGPEWPRNKKKMNKAEQEILEKHGKPDYMRLLWNREGRIAVRDELRSQLKDKPKTLPPMNWVYLEDGVEYSFKDKQPPTEKPINDEIRLVCRYGDPEMVKNIGPGVVQWTYYSTGKMYNISGGKIVSEKEFPAMGGYRK